MDLKAIGYKFLKKVVYFIPFLSICSLACGSACAAVCPKGLYSDPYPGECGRFIDLNGDGNCDLSKSEQANQDNQNNIIDENKANGNTGIDENQANGNNEGLINFNIGEGNNTEYFVAPIALIVLVFYGLSHILLTKNIINPKSHKSLWTILLIMTTLGSGITGIILLIGINLVRYFYNNIIIFIHVEVSIMMVMLVLVHMHINRKPIQKLFKFKWVK